mmetsp:Transcript_4330/g.5679  ORF Transcript_4330/g.5679 Transcript_4330/m.5679 type:complete len:422 (-) Transcript_4330:381-1646(-)|eukprot:CAMPEP_0117820840 /NCGR_PEP_ID=MMETSP0949-20121206/2707_1 /TAXON_ID=44440 /ORGANISM="Chattonella subsalsa, Strain CCMP2191" /LENGTH=421 /DNA_ID=CAMNT_0005659871 /DNA_START=78 /DNA_END=1343 /DNA_ORIENTATION=+
MRLTADLILRAEASINPCKERELNLRGFKIPVIENIGATQDMFDTIDFSDNEIKRLENFPRMERLTTLLLNNNHISKIASTLKDQLPNLTTLILTNNRVHHLAELDALEGLSKLTMISLLENPVVRRQHYRLYVIQRCPALKFLDFRKVKQKERAEAARLFKSKAGQRMQEDVKKELRTFKAGEKREREKRRLTETQKQLIREAIKNAKTPEEVDKLERQLRAGIMPNLALKAANPLPTPAVARPAPVPTRSAAQPPDLPPTHPNPPSTDNPAPTDPNSPSEMETDEKTNGTSNGPIQRDESEKEAKSAPVAMEMDHETKRQKTENSITPSNETDKMDESTEPQKDAQSPPEPETIDSDLNEAPSDSKVSEDKPEEALLSESDIKSMKVVQLKSELAKRNLPQNGVKAVLAQRLMEACGHE